MTRVRKADLHFGSWPLLLLLAVIIFSACDRNVVFEQNAEIPNNDWKSSQKVKLEFDVTDTVSQNNFYLNIRNTDDYKYRNLYVFVRTIFPNGKSSVDTVGCMLADATGKWLGRGNGFIFSNQVRTNRILYQYQRRFPLSGHYTVILEQAMRDKNLKGIMNVGLRIEKVENPRPM